MWDELDVAACAFDKAWWWLGQLKRGLNFLEINNVADAKFVGTDIKMMTITEKNETQIIVDQCDARGWDEVAMASPANNGGSGETNAAPNRDFMQLNPGAPGGEHEEDPPAGADPVEVSGPNTEITLVLLTSVSSGSPTGQSTDEAPRDASARSGGSVESSHGSVRWQEPNGHDETGSAGPQSNDDERASLPLDP
ncbi:hypothetical protein ZWY2020_017071 [Hordeum vulgare]|nr:hypothetical protein ZWY2020_017071 [Hordeum vulgare]